MTSCNFSYFNGSGAPESILITGGTCIVNAVITAGYGKITFGIVTDVSGQLIANGCNISSVSNSALYSLLPQVFQQIFPLLHSFLWIVV